MTGIPARVVAGIPAGVVVIGVGNDLRGDDGAGLEVVRRLRARATGAEPFTLALHEADGTGLLERWRGARAALLVDTVRSRAPAGTIHRLDASAEPLTARLSPDSSHAVGVADAIELARALGRLPRRVIVYGIEGARFALGAGLSDPVTAALDGVVTAVGREALEWAVHREAVPWPVARAAGPAAP